MIGNTPDQLLAKKQVRKNLPLALVTCALGFVGLFVAMIVRTEFTSATEKVGDMSIRFVGENLLYQYCMAFELISVVLLTAIIGAIILARGGREEETS